MKGGAPKILPLIHVHSRNHTEKILRRGVGWRVRNIIHRSVQKLWCVPGVKQPYVHHVSAHDVPPIDGIGLTSTEATSGTPRGSFPPPLSSKRNTLPQVKGVLSLNQNSKTALKSLKVPPSLQSHRKRWGKRADRNDRLQTTSAMSDDSGLAGCCAACFGICCEFSFLLNASSLLPSPLDEEERPSRFDSSIFRTPRQYRTSARLLIVAINESIKRQYRETASSLGPKVWLVASLSSSPLISVRKPPPLPLRGVTF